MNRRTTDILVGLFVLAGFGALVFLALQAGNLATFSTAPTYSVTAQFDNIGGLKVRAPVKSAGVVVGRVQDIAFDTDSFRARVTLSLEEAYPFPKDSSAKILTSGLLGEQYVGLEPGGDLENLAQGDKISLTQSAVVLENLIGQFLYNTSAEAGAK